jgi:hypothetical protein
LKRLGQPLALERAPERRDQLIHLERLLQIREGSAIVENARGRNGPLREPAHRRSWP